MTCPPQTHSWPVAEPGERSGPLGNKPTINPPAVKIPEALGPPVCGLSSKGTTHQSQPERPTVAGPLPRKRISFTCRGEPPGRPQDRSHDQCSPTFPRMMSESPDFFRKSAASLAPMRPVYAGSTWDVGATGETRLK